MKHRHLGRGIWLWPTISLCMLAGMMVEARTQVQASEADPHLARCRIAVDKVPEVIQSPDGPWIGSPSKVPDSAIQLLQPNAILSLRYVNQHFSDAVSLLIVNCRNAGDLMGHYPPICYPSQGEEEMTKQRQARVWHLPHMDVHGMEYHFAPKSPTDEEQTVYNFFVIPRVPSRTVAHKELDGVICPDMDGVDASGEDYQRRHFGAAEFQLVTGPGLTPQQRDQAMVDLLTPCEDLILTLENRPSGGNVP
jgi:hypothetical protein